MNESSDQKLTAKLEITIDIQAPQSSQIRRLLEPRHSAPVDKDTKSKEGFGRKLANFFGSISIQK